MTTSIKERVKLAAGPDGLHWSCLGNDGENKFRQLIEAVDRGRRNMTMVEIGTHQGVSASILADYGRVYTYDVIDWELRTPILRELDPKGNVHFYQIPTESDGEEEQNVEANEWLKVELANKEFDLAFIDGQHGYASVAANFEATRKCGAVIFHDYKHNVAHTGNTVKFVDALPIGRTTKWEPFAMWEDVQPCPGM